MSAPQNQLRQLFGDAGWLPPGEHTDWPISGDLLPSIQESWAACDHVSLSTRERRSATRMQSWLAAHRAQGAMLTLMSSESSHATHWVGERLLWWPHGRPHGSRIGIASSRIGRQLDTQKDWFTVFRAASAKITRDQDVLLTAAETTSDRFIRRAAELFGVRVASMICPRETDSIRAWLKRIRRLQPNTRESIAQAYVSPHIEPSSNASATCADFLELPLRDRLVAALAERLFVFHLRRGGQLEKLVRARLNDAAWPAASVFIALGEGLVDRRFADELLDCGAVGWVVLDTLRHEEERRRACSTRQKVPIVELPASDTSLWLTHCTRAQLDGWPDQRPTDYVDELLLNSNPTDHSAFASLRRIITMQRLFASSRMIRGDTQVVCFTAVPLRDLPRLRTFRSHLARWDFEPFGIRIRQDWLAMRRCSPVQYGDETLWESLAVNDRPFFQVRTSRTRRNEHVIDWSIECEWRHVGDVDLAELPSEAGLVFVPTQEAAEQLATISRWPVTVLGP